MYARRPTSVKTDYRPAMSWSPGDVVVLREVWADRFLAARPVRVVHAGDDYLSFYFAPGTPWKNDPRDHGEVRFRDGPWKLEDLVRDRPVLSFAFPETAYAVLLDWTVDGAFDGYYVNLQSPLRAWEGGFDYTDWFLDVVIDRDRASYRWKDEEELAEALQRGLVTPAQARDVRAAGERAIAHVLDAEPPFDEDRSAWRPDPSWEIPALPEDWDRAPPA
jgi:hypothetical protein